MTLNILVVDDADEFADLIVLDLISRDFNARAQYSGFSAFTSAFTLEFDLVLLDIMMPGDITLKELMQTNMMDDERTLIPLTDDVFFLEAHSNVPINDIIEANILNVQDILLKDGNGNIRLFQPLHIIKEVQNLLYNISDIYIHLDGYITSCLIKSTLGHLKDIKVLFFTAGGVDESFYRKYNSFFADGLFLKSGYYDKVIKELDYYKDQLSSQ